MDRQQTDGRPKCWQKVTCSFGSGALIKKFKTKISLWGLFHENNENKIKRLQAKIYIMLWNRKNRGVWKIFAYGRTMKRLMKAKNKELSE